jgi:hypothetical protein
MSRANGICRFGDGTIKFFLYDGDQALPKLHKTLRGAWKTKTQNLKQTVKPQTRLPKGMILTNMPENGLPIWAKPALKNAAQ